MKNWKKIISLIIMIASIFLIGCGEEEIDPSLLPLLYTDYYEVEVDEYIEFFVGNYDSIELFNLYSSDENIVEIDDDNWGYSLKPGKVKITAKLKSDERISESIYIFVKYEEIEYQISQQNILVDDVFTIDFYNYSSDDEFDIEISDDSILEKIGEKTYKALQEGKVSVILTLKNEPSISAKIDLDIYSKEPVIIVNSNQIFVEDCIKLQLLNYENAEIFDWKINDENLANIEKNVIYAKKAGTLVVTVSSKENPSLKTEVLIEIKPKKAELLSTATNLLVGGKARIFIGNLEELETNDFSKFEVIIEDKEIICYEDNMITALKLGSTTISVVSKENKDINGNLKINVCMNSEDMNSDDKKENVVIYSNDPTNYIPAGEFFQLYIDGDKTSNYKWVSDNSKVATVNENGRVIGVGKGTTLISAVSNDNKSLKAAVYVTVYGEPNVDYAARLVEIAAQEIGYQEGPDNDTKYGDWYGLSNQPWCAMFVSWCAFQAGISTEIIPRYCGCVAGMEWFKKQGLFQARESGYIPKAGDIIFFCTVGKADGSTHTGIVYATNDQYVYTIEGNTMDMCAKRSYYLKDLYIVGYGTPNYPSFEGEAKVFEPGKPQPGANLPTT